MREKKNIGKKCRGFFFFKHLFTDYSCRSFLEHVLQRVQLSCRCTHCTLRLKEKRHPENDSAFLFWNSVSLFHLTHLLFVRFEAANVHRDKNEAAFQFVLHHSTHSVNKRQTVMKLFWCIFQCRLHFSKILFTFL